MVNSLTKIAALAIVPALLQISSSLELKNRQSSIAAVDPFDHTWIEEWAALGESYASGLGAGHYIKGTEQIILNPGGFFAGYCYQYSYGYANIMNSNNLLGAQPNRQFYYLACSGAVASNILKDQVPLLKSPQMVTLSAGGNDAGLSTILNWCVYQWFTPVWGDCDSALANANKAINSDAFTQDLTDLIQGIKAKMRDPSNRIYWIGYTKFFDTSDTSCDSITWAIPRLDSYQYLTVERRQTMNNLVDLVNSKIQAVVAAAGAQVVYVDWQNDADNIAGRFCEPGVDETWNYTTHHGYAENREQSVFYEWGTTKDDDDDSEKGRDELRRRQDITAPLNTPAANATFEGSIANYIDQGAAMDPDSYTDFQQNFDVNTTGSLMPDTYGRVFHPTKFGHSLIAANIMDAITAEQAKLMNQPALTTTLSCDAAAATAASNPTQASEPTPTSTMQCHGVSGNIWVVSRDVVAGNANDFCGQTTNSVEYNQGTLNDAQFRADNIANGGSVSSAPDCVTAFMTIIDGCDGNDPVNNPSNYKFGGIYNSSNGWVYSMTPLAMQADADSCDVTYDFFFDTFEVRGKNFPDAKLGQDGSGLLAALRKCGDVTDWNFELTPDDTTYQWYAKGHEIIGQKNCIGNAVITAGGTTTGNCHGAG